VNFNGKKLAQTNNRTEVHNR